MCSLVSELVWVCVCVQHLSIFFRNACKIVYNLFYSEWKAANRNSSVFCENFPNLKVIPYTRSPGTSPPFARLHIFALESLFVPTVATVTSSLS